MQKEKGEQMEGRNRSKISEKDMMKMKKEEKIDRRRRDGERGEGVREKKARGGV